jgi:DNA-binding winged helix-turn-helix (wHTH) protein/Flp pilus assembly protein TadD/TolB-like protein
VLRFAGFELDLDRVELRTADGTALKLRPKTFALLQLFATSANRLLSKQELMAAIWPNVHVGEDSLFQCIREIRTALGDKDRQILKSVSGRGYLFEADVVADTQDAGPVPAPAFSSPAALPDQPAQTPVITAGTRWFHALRRPALAASLLVCFAVGIAVAAPMLVRRLSMPETLTIAVTPIEARTSDAVTATMAANFTDRLTDGLSKISNIRVLVPPAETGVTRAASTPSAKADFIVRGELQRNQDKWEIQARLIEPKSEQVQWSASYSVPSVGLGEQLQQTRLTAGIGNPLALQLNTLTHKRVPAPESKIVVEQAAAFINRTDRERFAEAQALLEKAHAAKPDDVDISAALSAHLMRGLALVWYPASETDAIEQRAKALLEDVVRKEPNYIPELQAYCRLLQTINELTESLVACENALRFNPWDGLAMFQLGMAQLRLGRFDDALATFERADAIDTPQVSRWTWLLGAGVALLSLERYEQALPWLERSLALTPASGRTDMAIAAALEALKRPEEARAHMQAGLKLRPGTTALNVALPPKNQSPRYNASVKQVVDLLVAAGLPPK